MKQEPFPRHSASRSLPASNAAADTAKKMKRRSDPRSNGAVRGCRRRLPERAAQPPIRCPSWNEGASKAASSPFVQAVTDTASKEFVPPEERGRHFRQRRHAVGEQPLYVQFVFMLDQLKAAAPTHPELKDDPAFAAMIKRRPPGAGQAGQKRSS